MKKKFYVPIILLFILLLSASPALADKPIQIDANGNESAWSQTNPSCATIQEGTIKDSAGIPLSMGYDQYGYNYQAHIFNGTYDSSDRIIDGAYWGQTGDYIDDHLMMKWSDEWLANVDCNHDDRLDRGLVNGVVGGTSLGWLTNHVDGWYDSDGDGTQDAHYTSFEKIVWTGIGSPLWQQYTIIEEVYNDPVGGYRGLQIKIGAPGFGLNDHWTVP